MKRLSDDFDSLGLAGQLLRISQIAREIPPEVVEDWRRRYLLERERRRQQGPSSGDSPPAVAETEATGEEASTSMPDWMEKGTLEDTGGTIIVPIDPPYEPPKRSGRRPKGA
jgi:hypothetical protein